jgi:hypothetical protein
MRLRKVLRLDDLPNVKGTIIHYDLKMKSIYHIRLDLLLRMKAIFAMLWVPNVTIIEALILD